MNCSNRNWKKQEKRPLQPKPEKNSRYYRQTEPRRVSPDPRLAWPQVKRKVTAPPREPPSLLHRADPRARRVELLPLHLGDDAADDAIAECRTAFELRRDIAKETALRRLGPPLTNY